MEYTTLGASGLQVSRPCLGAMMFGHGADAPTSEPDSHRIIDAYLEAGGNKAEAAKRAHLARPTLYERLRKIEEVLGVSLDSAQSRTSLHVAVLAQAAAREP